MEVENKGNVHVVTRGEIVIRTADGRTVARYPLGGGRGIILPNATVALRSVITRKFPPGDYQAGPSSSTAGAVPSQPTSRLRSTRAKCWQRE